MDLRALADQGYGFGVLRLAFDLFEKVSGENGRLLSRYTLEGELAETGIYEKLHQGLRLTDTWTVCGVFLELPYMGGIIAVLASTEIPLPSPGEEMPPLIPTWRVGDHGIERLESIRVGTKEDRVWGEYLRVD